MSALRGFLTYLLTRLGLLFVVVFLGLHFIGVPQVDLSNTGLPSPNDPEQKKAIYVEVESEGDFNGTQVAREATQYWETKGGAYLERDVNFIVKQEVEQPDILIKFTDSTPCDDGSSGCAPQTASVTEVKKAKTTQESFIAYIEADKMKNERTAEAVTKHELGHILSVKHCRRPHWLMGCPTSSEHEQGMVSTSEYAWREDATNLTVKLVTEDLPGESRENVRNTTRDVLDKYERYEKTPDDLQMTFTNDTWRADIIIKVGDCGRCDGLDQIYHVSYSGGQTYDTDGNLEYLMWGEAQVRFSSSPDVTRERIGRAIGDLVTPAEPPEEFEG